MNERLNQLLQRWLTETLPTVSQFQPSSIHLDELLGMSTSGIETVTISLQAYKILLEQLQTHQFPVKPMLVIPLVTISNKFERTVPLTINDLESQLSFEPPSLYLLAWHALEYEVEGEAYWIPLKFELLGSCPKRVHTYYKEVRYKDGIENDWEFTRAIYLEYGRLAADR